MKYDRIADYISINYNISVYLLSIYSIHYLIIIVVNEFNFLPQRRAYILLCKSVSPVTVITVESVVK